MGLEEGSHLRFYYGNAPTYYNLAIVGLSQTE